MPPPAGLGLYWLTMLLSPGFEICTVGPPRSSVLTFGVVLTTGILLQLKKQLAWVQPGTIAGAGVVPGVDFAALLAVVQAEPRMEVASWTNVNRVDYRPKDGVIKIDALNRWEMQIDATTGGVLAQVAYRRSI